MPVGEIIAIGTELLLGELQDSNTAYIARTFRDIGIDVYRTQIVGDNVNRIAQAIRESLSRADIVITTGGLGPTVDDPTRQAVAAAFERELEFHPELWQQIQDRFNRFHRRVTENNRRQAFLPGGATALENPVGTAPAFYFAADLKYLISLPGVPREMEHILHHQVIPFLTAHFSLGQVIKTYFLHAAGVGESQVDEWIGDLETNANPTVGLVAHPGQIDIRIAAKANSSAEAEALIADMAAQVKQRVGTAIYGSGPDTLESVTLSQLKKHSWSLYVIECGMNGAISTRLISAGFSGENLLNLTELCSPEDLRKLTRDQMAKFNTAAGIGAGFYPGPVQQELFLCLVTPQSTEEARRFYGGPPQHGPSWAVQTTLDFLRRNTL